MNYKRIHIPEEGERITMDGKGRLAVPERPVLPYIEGDGIGPDITRAALPVWNAAVQKAYGCARRPVWMQVYAGESAVRVYGNETWLPLETLDAIRTFLVAIKGPLTTPVGGGIRSLNVALRQELDLYVCLRPVRWFNGTPSPVRQPELTDMVVFRENSEDIYAGIEWPAGSPGCERVLRFLNEEMGVTRIRFPATTAIGIKPVSEQGTRRLVRAALQYALQHHRRSVTLVHKGNIMKYTEGAFRDWGYREAREHFGARPLDGGPWQVVERPDEEPLVIKDVIADAFLQQLLTRPAEYDVIATLNLNGDYISDALAACVGGIGMAPGANINYETGAAVFEATHGTAPKYAGRDQANPSSLILSGAMMFRYLGWTEAADLIEQALAATIVGKRVTYDLARLMEGTPPLSCSAFSNALVGHLRGMP